MLAEQALLGERPEQHSPATTRPLHPATMAPRVVLEDVVVQVDPPLGPTDGGDPVIVGAGAVLEELQPVALAQGGVAGSRQDAVQTGAA